jgi:hypothetical protein
LVASSASDTPSLSSSVSVASGVPSPSVSVAVLLPSLGSEPAATSSSLLMPSPSLSLLPSLFALSAWSTTPSPSASAVELSSGIDYTVTIGIGRTLSCVIGAITIGIEKQWVRTIGRLIRITDAITVAIVATVIVRVVRLIYDPVTIGIRPSSSPGDRLHRHHRYRSCLPHRH